MHYVLHGYYGAGNIGDDAILESIIDSIFLDDQNARFTVISKGVKSAYKGPRKVSVNKSSEVEKIRLAIKSCDRFILGGGEFYKIIPVGSHKMH
ncbi:hypothetical protein [Pontibacillus sp. HMF3514]|uniref:hypothetical protein n=1 Tax=Pontibacillus sp. HMF3514 TaxID=2692425 RepID=UPI0013201977|nr:hypothetical protein [Pontibacillus sp. HMF3514]QHE54111.1 hypothetical protein GS400_19715 [Pontibacillus sp. HMF3514]